MNASVSLSSISNNEENKQKEWPYFKCEGTTREFTESIVPLLIMEVHRLQPFFDINFPRLYVLNMPELKVRNVDISGIIRKVYPRSKLDLTVDDGTGRIQVLISWENMNKLKEERKNIDAKFQRLEKVAKLKNCGEDHIKDLENRWMQETQNGTLGKDLEVLDYVQVIGFIHLDFGRSNVTKKDVSLEKGNLCKPVVFAKTINRLTEKEYNNKIQNFILGTVKNRYQAN